MPSRDLSALSSSTYCPPRPPPNPSPPRAAGWALASRCCRVAVALGMAKPWGLLQPHSPRWQTVQHTLCPGHHHQAAHQGAQCSKKGKGPRAVQACSTAGRQGAVEARGIWSPESPAAGEARDLNWKLPQLTSSTSEPEEGPLPGQLPQILNEIQGCTCDGLCAPRSSRYPLRLGEERACPGDVCACADARAA